MRIPRKLLAVLTMSIMLTLSIGNNAHAEEISKEAMSSQLMQIAGIIQMQAQQLVMLAGGQQNGENQPMEQIAVNPMDIQAQQALMAQQALEAQQAMQAQQALEAQQAMQMQQALEAQQIQQAQQAMAIQQAQQAQQAAVDSQGFDTWNETQRQHKTGIIVINTKTMKIHNPWCDSVPKIAPENYVESTLSVDELIAQGYVQCGQKGDW